MLIEELTHTVPLPEGVSASYDGATFAVEGPRGRSEEHTSELQSQAYRVCRPLLEKKKTSTRLNYILREHLYALFCF